MNQNKLTVCVDFDGVLNEYDHYDENDLSTPRRFDKVLNWLQEHDLSKYVFDVTNTKLPAVAYIDDRAILFNGDYEDTIQALEYFEP